VKADRVAWHQVDNEIVALALDRSEYLATNESAAELWRMLAEGSTEAELAAALVTRWGIDAQQAQRDVSAFVKALSEHGVIEVAES
jgi:hypothetical protein